MNPHGTAHAVNRYRERVRPTLGFDECSEELERLLDGCEILAEPPEWVVPGIEDQAECWAILTEDIVCPIAANGTATTVLVRGLVPDAHRANVNRRKAERRKAKRFGKQSFGGRARAKSRIEDEAWPV